MLFHHLASSMLSGVAGSVTQPSAPMGSATTSQSSALGPPSVPSSGTDPWYLDFYSALYYFESIVVCLDLSPSLKCVS
jgi:hypothetical protein